MLTNLDINTQKDEIIARLIMQRALTTITLLRAQKADPTEVTVSQNEIDFVKTHAVQSDLKHFTQCEIMECLFS